MSTYVTLDGVMEAPEKWFLRFWNEEAAEHAHEQLFVSDALLLGRVAYQGFRPPGLLGLGTISPTG